MKRHSAILLTALITALCVVAQAQNKGEVLIKNATIMTASRGVIEGGSILIRDGKIAAVGKNSEVRAGANARVIDATGMYVTPGLIDAHSHSALDTINEGTVSVSAMVRMIDVVDNTDISIYRQLAGGTTTIHSMHGSANSIGGTNAVIKLRWGKDARGLQVGGGDAASQVAVDVNVVGVNHVLDAGHGGNRNAALVHAAVDGNV